MTFSQCCTIELVGNTVDWENLETFHACSSFEVKGTGNFHASIPLTLPETLVFDFSGTATLKSVSVKSFIVNSANTIVVIDEFSGFQINNRGTSTINSLSSDSALSNLTVNNDGSLTINRNADLTISFLLYTSSTSSELISNCNLSGIFNIAGSVRAPTFFATEDLITLVSEVKFFDCEVTISVLSFLQDNCVLFLKGHSIGNFVNVSFVSVIIDGSDASVTADNCHMCLFENNGGKLTVTNSLLYSLRHTNCLTILENTHMAGNFIANGGEIRFFDVFVDQLSELIFENVILKNTNDSSSALLEVNTNEFTIGTNVVFVNGFHIHVFATLNLSSSFELIKDVTIVNDGIIKGLSQTASTHLILSGGTLTSTTDNSSFSLISIDWKSNDSIFTGKHAANNDVLFFIHPHTTFIHNGQFESISKVEVSNDGVFKIINPSTFSSLEINTLHIHENGLLVLSQKLHLLIANFNYEANADIMLMDNDITFHTGTQSFHLQTKFSGKGNLIFSNTIVKCASCLFTGTDLRVSLYQTKLSSSHLVFDNTLIPNFDAGNEVDSNSSITANSAIFRNTILNFGSVSIASQLSFNSCNINGLSGLITLTDAIVSGDLTSSQNKIVFAHQSANHRNTIIGKLNGISEVEVVANSPLYVSGSLSCDLMKLSSPDPFTGEGLVIDGTVSAVTLYMLNEDTLVSGDGSLSITGSNQLEGSSQLKGRFNDLTVKLYDAEFNFDNFVNNAKLNSYGSILKGTLTNDVFASFDQNTVFSAFTFLNNQVTHLKGVFSLLNSSVFKSSSNAETVVFASKIVSSDALIELSGKVSFADMETTALAISVEADIEFSKASVDNSRPVTFINLVTFSESTTFAIKNSLTFTSVKVNYSTLTSTTPYGIISFAQNGIFTGSHSSVNAMVYVSSFSTFVGEDVFFQNFGIVSNTVNFIGTITFGAFSSTSSCVFTNGDFIFVDSVLLSDSLKIDNSSLITKSSCISSISQLTFTVLNQKKNMETNEVIPFWRNEGTIQSKSLSYSQEVIVNHRLFVLEPQTSLKRTMVNYDRLILSSDTVLDSVVSHKGTVELLGEVSVESSTFKSTSIIGTTNDLFTSTYSDFIDSTINLLSFVSSNTNFANSFVSSQAFSCMLCKGSLSLETENAILDYSTFGSISILENQKYEKNECTLSNSRIESLALSGKNTKVISLGSLELLPISVENSGSYSVLIEKGAFFDVQSTISCSDVSLTAILNRGGTFRVVGVFNTYVSLEQQNQESLTILNSQLPFIGTFSINEGRILVRGQIGLYSGGKIYVGNKGHLSLQFDEVPTDPFTVKGFHFHLADNSKSSFSIFGLESHDKLSLVFLTQEPQAFFVIRFENGFVPKIGDYFTVIEYETTPASETILFPFSSDGVDPRALEVRFHPIQSGSNVTVHVIGCPDGFHSEPINECVPIVVESSSESTDSEISFPKWPPIFFFLLLALGFLYTFTKESKNAKMPLYFMQSMFKAISTIDVDKLLTEIGKPIHCSNLEFLNNDGEKATNSDSQTAKANVTIEGPRLDDYRQPFSLFPYLLDIPGMISCPANICEENISDSNNDELSINYSEYESVLECDFSVHSKSPRKTVLEFGDFKKDTIGISKKAELSTNEGVSSMHLKTPEFIFEDDVHEIPDDIGISINSFTVESLEKNSKPINELDNQNNQSDMNEESEKVEEYFDYDDSFEVFKDFDARFEAMQKKKAESTNHITKPKRNNSHKSKSLISDTKSISSTDVSLTHNSCDDNSKLPSSQSVTVCSNLDPSTIPNKKTLKPLLPAIEKTFNGIFQDKVLERRFNFVKNEWMSKFSALKRMKTRKDKEKGVSEKDPKEEKAEAEAAELRDDPRMMLMEHIIDAINESSSKMEEEHDKLLQDILKEARGSMGGGSAVDNLLIAGVVARNTQLPEHLRGNRNFERKPGDNGLVPSGYLLPN